ncbi:PREDICTED: uncharacterized protein LOC104816197 [Tarenaya hassleriana]|uniref:uncharacterized protein LOC104816197 n=1 Tax=Tarenaya hassleriana TaxID=28532 RepID=UPI00053C2A8F|nr:PREDICTED: uncharacterized protein LOC104816197 [Tarenaya hassleriana]
MAEKANPKSGCFTTVVRRLLCSGSQQTHPSDNIPDAEVPFELHFEEEPKKDPIPENDDVSVEPSGSSAIAPNVVAKLMGLGDVHESTRVRYDERPGSVTRSKSVNFMDYILRIDEEEEEEDEKDGQRCRRVKASVSFREILPSSARSKSNNQKRHDFLLLYLDKLDENREIGSRSRRFEKVIEDPKPKGNKDDEKEVIVVAEKKENRKVAKKFKDEPRKAVKKSEKRSDVRAKKVRWFLSPSKSKDKVSLIGEPKSPSPAPEIGELAGEGRGSKRVAGKEGDAGEKSDSSPVSVLDRDLYDYLILDDDYYSGDCEMTPEWKPEKRSSPAKTKTSKKEGNSDEETEFTTKLMKMLSELSEEDMKSSSWVSSNTDPIGFDRVEDFCVDFGQEIIDLIMDQLVDELCI